VVRPSRTTPWAVVALLGGGIAWAVHLLASYAVVSVGCATGWWGTRPLLGAVTVACIALAVATGVLAQRGRRQTAVGASAASPARFTFTVGAGLATLFTALIVLGGIVPFIVPLCEAA
jgi:hypothetical protein